MKKGDTLRHKYVIAEEVALEVLSTINSGQQLNGTNRFVNAAQDVI